MLKSILICLSLLMIGSSPMLGQSVKKKATPAPTPTPTQKTKPTAEPLAPPVQKVVAPEANLPEPEYIGVFSAYDSNEHKPVPLERQTLKVFTLTSGGLFSTKVTSFQGLVGTKSPNRFHENQNVVFLVRAESNLVDPVNLFSLSKLIVRNNIRVLSSSSFQFKMGVIGSNGGMEGMSSRQVQSRITRLGTSSFKITFQLEPGEYVFTSKLNDNVFSFGIDPDPNAPSPDLTTVAGRYNREGSKKDYIELKPDGTLVLQQGKKYEGTFTLQGSTVTYTIKGVTSQIELVGNTIIDPDQMQWVKQSP